MVIRRFVVAMGLLVGVVVPVVAAPNVTVRWEETATEKIKIKCVDGVEVGRWSFVKKADDGAGPEPKRIEMTATVTGPYTVEAAIRTNLPDGVVLAVSLELQGMVPQDPFIGTNYVRVPVQQGAGKVLLDGTKQAMPFGSKLPTGLYDVVVKFYPKWTENGALSKAAGIKDECEARAAVRLAGSGKKPPSRCSKGELRAWVAKNARAGSHWVPKVVGEELGRCENVDYTGVGGDEAIVCFYFPAADQTFIIDAGRVAIKAVREGRVGK